MLERKNTPRVRLKVDELDRLIEPLGYRTDDAKAKYLRISPATMHRLRNDKANPDNATIAAIRTAFPKLAFEQLFEVVQEQGSVA